MIINPEKRILDYNGQAVRIFERFFDRDYDDMETKNGIYDVVIMHREGFQDSWDDVRTYITDETTLIIDITTESGNLQSCLDDLKIKTDNIPNKVYFFVDSDISEYLKNVEVKYQTIQGYEIVFYAFTNPSSDSFVHLNKTHKNQLKNGFMSFNGSLRTQRVLLLLELLKNNIDISHSSFLFYIGVAGSKHIFDRNEYDIMCLELYSQKIITKSDLDLLKKVSLPISVDYNLTEPTYIFNSIDDTYNYPLNFVTENVTGLVDGDVSPYGLITFTEKTLKPFVASQIPMIFGLLGLNKILRNLGFDLFDDLIQHHLYENIEDPYERLKSMVVELKRVLELDLVEYKRINRHRFVNNYTKVYEISNKGFDILNDFYKSNIL